MAFSGDAILRANVTDLLPEQTAKQVIQAATKLSAALALIPIIPMSARTFSIPVTAALAQAFWLDDDDLAEKSASTAAWKGVRLTARELAVIVIVPIAVLNDLLDGGFDAWGMVQPQISEAFADKIDRAVFAGVGPFVGIVPQAIAAGHVVSFPTATQSEGGIAEDINQTRAFVLRDGFLPSGIVADALIQVVTAGARDTTGQLLTDVANGSVAGLPAVYVRHGVLDPDGSTSVLAVVGDVRAGARLGLRQDIEYTFLKEAQIGAVNLATMDAVALRTTMRVAFATANPTTRENPNTSNGDTIPSDRFPFAVLLGDAGS